MFLELDHAGWRLPRYRPVCRVPCGLSAVRPLPGCGAVAAPPAAALLQCVRHPVHRRRDASLQRRTDEVPVQIQTHNWPPCPRTQSCQWADTLVKFNSPSLLSCSYSLCLCLSLSLSCTVFRELLCPFWSFTTEIFLFTIRLFSLPPSSERPNIWLS